MLDKYKDLKYGWGNTYDFDADVHKTFYNFHCPSTGVALFGLYVVHGKYTTAFNEVIKRKIYSQRYFRMDIENIYNIITTTSYSLESIKHCGLPYYARGNTLEYVLPKLWYSTEKPYPHTNNSPVIKRKKFKFINDPEDSVPPYWQYIQPLSRDFHTTPIGGTMVDIYIIQRSPQHY